MIVLPCTNNPHYTTLLSAVIMQAITPIWPIIAIPVCANRDMPSVLSLTTCVVLGGHAAPSNQKCRRLFVDAGGSILVTLSSCGLLHSRSHRMRRSVCTATSIHAVVAAASRAARYAPSVAKDARVPGFDPLLLLGSGSARLQVQMWAHRRIHRVLRGVSH